MALVGARRRTAPRRVKGHTVKFMLTPEQEELRELVRQYVSDKAPLAATRNLLGQDRDFDPVVWASMARELDLAGVDIDESLGGAGLTSVELALAAVELGAALYSGPFLAGAGLAAGLLRAADPQPNTRIADLLGSVSRGAILTAAVPDQGGAWRADAVTCEAVEHADRGWSLTGAKVAVLQADQAELLLVAARTPVGACSLFAVEPGTTSIRRMDSIDPTRSLCRVELDAAPGELLVDRADQAITDGWLRGCVLLAAESLGGARQCLEMTAEYARTRVQFGRPIGAFQAVKHRLVDTLVEVELATSAVYLAACHLTAGDPAIAGSAPMALHSATQAFSRAAADAVQIHGGVAFTWEHDAHLFVKRARANRQLLGRPVDQLDAVYANVAAAG